MTSKEINRTTINRFLIRAIGMAPYLAIVPGFFVGGIVGGVLLGVIPSLVLRILLPMSFDYRSGQSFMMVGGWIGSIIGAVLSFWFVRSLKNPTVRREFW